MKESFISVGVALVLLLGVFPVEGGQLDREACSLGETWSQADNGRPGCSGMDGLVVQARVALQGASTPAEKLDHLNHFFFVEERFQPAFDLDSPDRLLPGKVIANKKGHCVGLAAVYLILAEELGLPIRAVATPKHVFLRWEGRGMRRNIELFEKGRDAPDEEYVRQEKIPQESIEQGVFMKSLSPRQFLAFLYQNRGVLESQQGKFADSAKDYEQALKLNGNLEAAYYNRGNDSLKQERFAEAVQDYTKALELYPTDLEALKNRAQAWKRMGNAEAAGKDWQSVRQIDPAFVAPE